MKKSVLALTLAAALPLGTMPAYAQDATDETTSSNSSSRTNEDAAQTGQDGDGSSSQSQLSPGAIVGITLGVLAAVGAGAIFAVQQGLIPGFDLDTQQMAALSSLPAIPALAALGIGAGTGGGNVCAPSQFDSAVPGWPGATGTTVGFCDGKWAVAGQSQTDWIVPFERVNNRWVALRPDGTKQSGLYQGCYNGITLRQKGAPEAFMSKIAVCTPAEIGR